MASLTPATVHSRPRRVVARSRTTLVRVQRLTTIAELESSPKYLLAKQINRLLDEQGLGQLAAAKRLGIPQPKVSAIRNLKLHGISVGRLITALVALDQRVTIHIGPRDTSAQDMVSVAF